MKEWSILGFSICVKADNWDKFVMCVWACNRREADEWSGVLGDNAYIMVLGDGWAWQIIS